MRTYLHNISNEWLGKAWEEVEVDESQLEKHYGNCYLYEGMRVYQCDPVADEYFWSRYDGQIYWLKDTKAFEDDK